MNTYVYVTALLAATSPPPPFFQPHRTSLMAISPSVIGNYGGEEYNIARVGKRAADLTPNRDHSLPDPSV